jgi:hypothetical protein
VQQFGGHYGQYFLRSIPVDGIAIVDANEAPNFTKDRSFERLHLENDPKDT